MSGPFRIRGGGRGGVLLVHGFTGSPAEMAPLAAPLAAAGFDVLGVRLPGHGAAEPGERNEVSAWRAAVREGFGELAGHHAAPGGRGIAIVGLSMGALLGLELARSEPRRVGAVVALSPAVALPPALSALLGAGRWLLPPGARRRTITKGESDIRDAAARAAHPQAPPVPISAVLSFDGLRRAVRREVHGVTQPVLVVHSRLDRTCPVSGARWLARRLGAGRGELHLLERSGHVIPVDLEAGRAETLVLDFLDRRLPRR